jgi:uncharacterized YccA/Bax inhibitor family protein
MRADIPEGSMHSSNPVFSRSDGFNGRPSAAVQTDPSQWTIDTSGQPAAPGYAPPAAASDRMTVESVVEKTALTLGVLTVAAAVTWFMLGDVTATQQNLQNAQMAAFGGAIIGFGLAMVNSFKRVVSPALVLAYAAAEGVLVGAFSKVIASWIGDASIVFQAVLGTFVAFAGTLAAYKFLNIQVTDKFRKVVVIAGMSIVGVLLINMVLSFTGVLESGGLRGFNTLGLVVSIGLVILGTFFLILDFDFVEKGVQAGLPQRESWRAAFGLTVTLIWIYLEMLRILAILRGD